MEFTLLENIIIGLISIISAPLLLWWALGRYNNDSHEDYLTQWHADEHPDDDETTKNIK